MRFANCDCSRFTNYIRITTSNIELRLGVVNDRSIEFDVTAEHRSSMACQCFGRLRQTDRLFQERVLTFVEPEKGI